MNSSHLGKDKHMKDFFPFGNFINTTWYQHMREATPSVLWISFQEICNMTDEEYLNSSYYADMTRREHIEYKSELIMFLAMNG
jgi:hypothetical protein